MSAGRIHHAQLAELAALRTELTAARALIRALAGALRDVQRASAGIATLLGRAEDLLDGVRVAPKMAVVEKATPPHTPVSER